MGHLVGTAKILPVVAELFKQNERKKKIEEIMSGRWLPNTPTAEVAYLTYVINGLPIPEDMANAIYDEFLQKQGGDAFENSDVVTVRKEFSDQPRSREDETQPTSPVSDEDEKLMTTGKEMAQEWLKGLIGGVLPDRIAEGEPDIVRGLPNQGGGGTVPSQPPQPPSFEGRQVDPFIRMLQVALVMRMLGGTGGAFGALALAPILKDLFDEMMGRKKRDTGQGGEAKPSTTPLTTSQNNTSTERLEPRPAVDEVVIQLYNRGASPQLIASLIPAIVSEVDLTPEQVEQILNNSGVQGVHIPVSQPKERLDDKKKEPEKKKEEQEKRPQQPQRRPQPPSQPQRRLA